MYVDSDLLKQFKDTGNLFVRKIFPTLQTLIVAGFESLFKNTKLNFGNFNVDLISDWLQNDFLF